MYLVMVEQGVEQVNRVGPAGAAEVDVLAI